MTLTAILLFLIWSISLSYMFWILKFNMAWNQLKTFPSKQISSTNISVVIAFRNEAKHLPALLQSLYMQDFSQEDFEIIFIDDHSEDQGRELIKNFQLENPQLSLELLQLNADSKGKKAALQMGYQQAKNEIILCTDGDCQLAVDWLKITAAAFADPQKKLYSGGVYLSSGKGFLQAFQSLELMSLIGSGAAAIALQSPLMCNGANLSFRKSILDEIEPTSFKNDLASGDDVFLLMETKKRYGSAAIGFIKNKEHWVETHAETHMTGWFNQRIRWVSKSGSYSDTFQIVISLLVLLQNLLIIVLFVSSFFIPVVLETLLVIYLLKMMTDFFFLRNICRHMKQTKLLKHLPLVTIIYPFMISFVAIAGQFSSFKWKGRSYKK